MKKSLEIAVKDAFWAANSIVENDYDSMSKALNELNELVYFMTKTYSYSWSDFTHEPVRMTEDRRKANSAKFSANASSNAMRDMQVAMSSVPSAKEWVLKNDEVNFVLHGAVNSFITSCLLMIECKFGLFKTSSNDSLAFYYALAEYIESRDFVAADELTDEDTNVDEIVFVDKHDGVDMDSAHKQSDEMIIWTVLLQKHVGLDVIDKLGRTMLEIFLTDEESEEVYSDGISAAREYAEHYVQDEIETERMAEMVCA